MDLSLILAVSIASITLLSAADLFFGIKRLKNLGSIGVPEQGSRPLVSLIVPACNEEEHVAEAIASFLGQSYPHLEIIAINDRSTDKTGEILKNLQSTHENVTVIDIKKLPAGWMGKAHALHCGAAQASGEYLLFTDGDVSMDSTSIARAVHQMVNTHLDHLSIIFRNTAGGIVLNGLVLESGAGLIQLFRPWLAADKASSNFMGVGAFNMVKREVYQAVGGHSTIKMHPIDDIMLGKIIKRSGYAQQCLLGADLVTVPWYNSISAMVNGLMKNVLAMINYNFFLVPPLLLVIVVLNILPLWGVIIAEDLSRILFLLAVVVKQLTFYFGTRLLHISPWCALATIITPYISCYIVIKATWLNFRDRGIIWRGTHYPLRELRKNPPLLP